MLMGIVCPIVLSLLACVIVVVDGAGSHKDGAFRKVESLLRKMPRGCVKDTCKMEFYMSKVEAKLKAEDKKHMFRSKNKELISALNDLLFLEKAVLKDLCRPESWKVLKKLEESVSQKDLPKVKEIVNHFGGRYYEQCINTKISRYSNEHSRLERRLHETLEPFLNRLIFARVCGYSQQTGRIIECNLDSSSAVTKLVSQFDRFEELDKPVFIDELRLMIVGIPYEAHLREALMSERSISEPSMKSEFEHLLDENIVMPCKQFVEHMEPIYSDAAGSLNLLEMHYDDEKGSRFFLGLAHYKLCKQAVHHPEKMLRIVFGGDRDMKH